MHLYNLLICCLAISSTMSKSLLDKKIHQLRNTSTVEAEADAKAEDRARNNFYAASQ